MALEPDGQGLGADGLHEHIADAKREAVSLPIARSRLGEEDHGQARAQGLDLSTQGQAFGAWVGHDQIHGCRVLRQMLRDELAAGEGLDPVPQAAQVLLELCFSLSFGFEQQDVSMKGFPR